MLKCSSIEPKKSVKCIRVVSKFSYYHFKSLHQLTDWVFKQFIIRCQPFRARLHVNVLNFCVKQFLKSFLPVTISILIINRHNKEFDCFSYFLGPIIRIQYLEKVQELPFLSHIIEKQKCLSLPNILRVVSNGIIRNNLSCNGFRLSSNMVTHFFQLRHIQVTIQARNYNVSLCSCFCSLQKSVLLICRFISWHIEQVFTLLIVSLWE